MHGARTYVIPFCTARALSLSACCCPQSVTCRQTAPRINHCLLPLFHLEAILRTSITDYNLTINIF
uniref:Uncharacterized protein n=1 Tax=Oryza brachyantha TaxID=4533 RepID=J3NBI7_ORYBR